jgi:hypothetical protein
MRHVLFAAALFAATLPAAADDGAALKAQIVKTYPSLAYVDRYRQVFPDEVLGQTPFWHGTAPKIADAKSLMAALLPLADQHVALTGSKAGKSETLGMLFRTSSDGSMIVWRVFDPAVHVHEGDEVTTINHVPVREWLKRAGEMTFGGNRRGRMAEAATELGLATPIVHRLTGLGTSVILGVGGHDVVLPYLPMTPERAGAMAAAIDRADLLESFAVAGRRVGTIRIGAFAPQYDPVFVAASDAAAKAPGTSDDQAMLAGYCAVVHRFTTKFDRLAAKSDVVLFDIRGNLGGFDREARLMADAVARTPTTFDLFRGEKPGTVRLADEKRDPPCGHAKLHRPLLVLDDAATRSGGEFFASWLWAAGATVVGERTVGAGGGFEFDAKGFILPASGFGVRASENFTLFDPKGALRDGDWPEAALIDTVAADGFAPSRVRPFATQSAGLRPDIRLDTTRADLNDKGVGEITKALETKRP